MMQIVQRFKFQNATVQREIAEIMEREAAGIHDTDASYRVGTVWWEQGGGKR